MFVSRRELIMLVQIAFAEVFLITDVSSAPNINTDGVEQFQPAMLEMYKELPKAIISKRSEMNFGNYSNYFQGQFSSSCKNCGLINSQKKNSMIIKGENVDPPYKYPFMVQLNKVLGRGRFHSRCGGAIINEYYILTAAHCIQKNNGDDPNPVYFHPKELAVKFMTATYDTKFGPEVEKLIPHPDYKPWKNDIALVKLKNKITCNKFINPICLPPPDIKFPYGKVIQTAGWGKIEGGAYQKELREGSLKYLEFSKCRVGPEFQETNYCVQGLQKGLSPCSGDSGGPVFFEHKGKYIVVGLNSRSNYKTITLLTTVPKYIKWIKDVTKSTF